MNSYLNNNGVDSRLSLIEILQKVGSANYNKEYVAENISFIKIDGNVFTNYGQYSFIWEKSYAKSPTRSVGGSIGNLNEMPTFIVPHLVIDFSIMSIDDYRKLMILHYDSNEHIVECYDPIYNRMITEKMYFATEEMAKLHTIAQKRFLNGVWEEWIDLVGVREYTVELIGTNNDEDKQYTVRYVYNAPTGADFQPIYPNGVKPPDQYEQSPMFSGQDFLVGANSTFPKMPPNENYEFLTWRLVNEKGEDLGTRKNGAQITINQNLTFYAIWSKIK